MFKLLQEPHVQFAILAPLLFAGLGYGSVVLAILAATGCALCIALSYTV